MHDGSTRSYVLKQIYACSQHTEGYGKDERLLLHKVFKSTVPTSNEAAPNGRQLIATLEDSNESAN